MLSGSFPKIGNLWYFSAKLAIFLCFNAKGSCPKHSMGEGAFPAFFITSLIMGGGNIVSLSLFVFSGDGILLQVLILNCCFT